MEIKLNYHAESAYQMFNLTNERSQQLVDRMADRLGYALDHFDNEYKIMGVVKQEDGSSEIMARLDTAKLLSQLIALAKNEDEKNYVLYCAYTGINRLYKIIFEEPV